MGTQPLAVPRRATTRWQFSEPPCPTFTVSLRRCPRRVRKDRCAFQNTSPCVPGQGISRPVCVRFLGRPVGGLPPCVFPAVQNEAYVTPPRRTGTLHGLSEPPHRKRLRGRALAEMLALYTLRILTHREYDDEKWKDEL